MEHKKVYAKLPLNTALLLLEQLVLTTRIHDAKIRTGHIELKANSRRGIKAIKKALSDCCPELFDSFDSVRVEVELEYNNDVELTLQAFRRPKFGYIVAVQ